MFLFSLIITSNDVCIKNNVFSYETDTTVIEFKIQKQMEAFYIFVSSNYVCVCSEEANVLNYNNFIYYINIVII